MKQNSSFKTQNCSLYTIGHSTHPFSTFVRMLQTYDVSLLVDIRTIPRSRHNPQFNGDTLPADLLACEIGYEHMKGLGGLRKTVADSVNTGWENASFRGFADYMQTEQFAENLERLIAITRQRRVAIMCAEALPWRCHRSLISDALFARGIGVDHVMSDGKLRPHTLTSFARVDGVKVTYPGPKTGHRIS